MTTLALNNVSKSYDAENVLSDVNFEVADGEMIVIVGPSGCGKSSLLRMVAGLEPITAGEVLINGQVVNKVEPKDRDIAMVFQNYALYPHMTVFANMAYGLKLRGLSVDAIKKRVTETALLLGLENLLERKPAALSGGQRQRVAMGRAIVRKPAIFLFDEPLSNLDAKLRVRMRLEIKALQQRLGVTSLYVTHDQVEAMTLADRLIILNDGAIEQIDTPMNVYQRPASTYVAGFIGTPPMNLLKCRVVSSSKNEVSVVHHEVATFRLPGGRVAKASSDEVTVGIRPDHLVISEGNQAKLECAVQAIETLGSETLVHGRIAETPEDSAPFIVKLDGNTLPRIGEVLPLSYEMDAIHLFDGNTGLRLASS
ncbi:sn-glycerol-3-phosphate ABC transporter ATP-binding protein UgpC [Pseudomonadales bacterium]|nr:sn-glycerol-3-phosphate ABC transporter ATP-binding protein UgpC [Pseudomonadales bacterium]